MSSCFHIFSSKVSFGQAGDVLLFHFSETRGFLFQSMTSEKVFVLSLCLLFCCFAPCFLKGRQMLSCYGQRVVSLVVWMMPCQSTGRSFQEETDAQISKRIYTLTSPYLGLSVCIADKCKLFYHLLAW